MRVYVAGKLDDDAHTVKRVMGTLKAAGHIITFDWTNPAAYGITSSNLSEIALWERKAVRSADVLVYCPHPDAHGTLMEVGMALGLGKSVFVIRDAEHAYRNSIFWKLPGVRLVFEGELLDLLS